MPSLRKTYEKMQKERAAKKNTNTTQKSTTDSDEQVATKEAKTEEVLKTFFRDSAEQKTRLKLYRKREPKIKPNYHTKAGGMLLIEQQKKNIATKPEEEKVEESKGSQQPKIQLEPPEESKELSIKGRSKS